MNPAFRQRCIGTFIHGATSAVVAQDSDGHLTLTVGSQPTYKLRPYQGRTFDTAELEGFRVEFQVGSHGQVEELIFHQPNGTFVARRAVVAERHGVLRHSYVVLDEVAFMGFPGVNLQSEVVSLLVPPPVTIGKSKT